VNGNIEELKQNIEMKLQAKAQWLKRYKREVTTNSNISSSMKMPRRWFSRTTY
jgi:hypothetical protein